MNLRPLSADFRVERSTDPVQVPKRVAFIQANLTAHVLKETEARVMTFPALIVRGVIGLNVTLIVLSLFAMLVDAPLEGLASPLKTPNPAKAPWYFLGLQELLHYFPPVVAGVLIPTLVIVALVVIPYFEVNIVREKLWKEHEPGRLYFFLGVVLLLTILLTWFRVWVVFVPTVLIALLMSSTFFPTEWGLWSQLVGYTRWGGRIEEARAKLGTLSLAAWIMIWFVTVTTVLTLVGTFFRGPGWSWVWPWEI